MLENAYTYIYIVAMSILAILVFIILIKAIKGPRVTDRIVCANMIGTIIIMEIALLSQLLKESYLIDVCLVYAMVSFISVVVLYRVYSTANKKKNSVHISDEF